MSWHIYDLHPSEFHISCSNGPLVTAIILKAKYRFHVAVTFNYLQSPKLFCTWKNITLSRNNKCTWHKWCQSK